MEGSIDIPRGAVSPPGPLARVFIMSVRFYQATLGPLMGGHCRFQPTCSNYAIEALRTHGAVRGSWLALRRILQCHPLGGFGEDPVPGGGQRSEIRDQRSEIRDRRSEIGDRP